MLSESNKCPLLAMKTPKEKIEKNRLYTIFFVAGQFSIGSLVFFLDLPAFSSNFYGILYLLLFLLTFVLYIVVNLSDPGVIYNDHNNTLLRLIKNPDVDITEYCPSCVVKKKR